MPFITHNMYTAMRERARAGQATAAREQVSPSSGADRDITSTAQHVFDPR